MRKLMTLMGLGLLGTMFAGCGNHKIDACIHTKEIGGYIVTTSKYPDGAREMRVHHMDTGTTLTATDYDPGREWNVETPQGGILGDSAFRDFKLYNLDMYWVTATTQGSQEGGCD